MRVPRFHIPVILIVIFGAILRFTNLNWDNGGRLHPDEALIVNGAIAIKFFSQLFPGFHDYNGLSVYLLAGVTQLASLVSGSLYWSQSPEGVTIVGRFLSALMGTVSIPLLYLLGKRLWRHTAGIYAAAFLVSSPLIIQLAHFYTTENLLLLLLIILLNTAAAYTQKPDRYSLIAMSITMGLLLATKNTAYLFLPIPLAIILISRKPLPYVTSHGLLFFAICGAAFFAGSPYSLLDLSGYMTRSKYLADVVSGVLPMDWTIQFRKTDGFFWFPTLLYATGFLVIIGIIGSIPHIRYVRKNIRGIFAAWSLGFLLFLAFTFLKFTRYAAPLIPFFALFAAGLLSDWEKTFAGKLISYTTIGLHIFYACIFFSIYSTPHTSLTAATWIGDNVPPSSVILTEEWNSIVRFSRPELDSKNYRIVSFNFYAPDTEIKQKNLLSLISQTDYILLESPKVKNTVARLSADYPNTYIFYNDLENNRLGFTKAAQFTSYPRIGSFAINDSRAEETFTIFDHPTVTLYKRQNLSD